MSTWADVLRGLGLSPRGRNHYNVQRRATELGLDCSGIVRRRRSWSDDDLRRAVLQATSHAAVLQLMGVATDAEPRERERVRTRIYALALDTSHFVATRVAAPKRRRRRRWSDEQLREAVRSSSSYAGAISKLGLIAAGGNYDHVRRRIRELALDTSHFRGQGWNVRWQFDPRPTNPLEEVLVAGRWTSTYWLKIRLFKAGLKSEKCERCGWAESAPDGRIPVELDHVNGDKLDNRLENLRILCPNRHALQPTHRGLNQRRRKK